MKPLRGDVVPVPAIPAVPSSAVFQVTVDNMPVPVNDESSMGFHTAAFCLSGSAKVTVTIAGAAGASTVRIQPSRHNLKPESAQNAHTFTLTEPLKLVITAGDGTRLALLATPPETAVPRPSDPDVIYFAPGLHEAGVIRPRSGQTIYLAPGARVKGRIEARGVANVRLLGRGVLDASAYSTREDKTTAILFDRCAKIRVDGIGVRGGSWWQTLFLLTSDAHVSHLNLFGVGVNTDGIDIDGATRFRARHCFIRCEDDGFGWHAIDAQTNGEVATLDAQAEDCVIWNSRAGNGIRIGASMEGSLFQDIAFRRIDILHHANAAIRSDHSDWAVCRNLRFESIVDETAEGKLIDFAIERTRYSNNTGYRDERGRMEGVHFIDVAAPAGAIELRGYDREHEIRDVTFKKCRIGGRLVRQLEEIRVNEFVTRVRFQNDEQEAR